MLYKDENRQEDRWKLETKEKQTRLTFRIGIRYTVISIKQSRNSSQEPLKGEDRHGLMDLGARFSGAVQKHSKERELPSPELVEDGRRLLEALMEAYLEPKFQDEVRLGSFLELERGAETCLELYYFQYFSIWLL